MKKHQLNSLLLWGATGALFVAFLTWHGAFESPLTDAEIDRLVARYMELNPDEDEAGLRQFLEEDDGNPVVMVNAIQLHDRPVTVNGRDFGDSSAAALNEYSRFVFGYLLRRGSYPLWTGNAVFDSLEVWGIDNAELWSTAGLVRYRSRRVMLEMATDPDFVRFHDAKVAAIQKTFAYPTRTGLAASSLSLTVGLILIVLALGGQLLITRQTRAQ
ncbi:MAG: hypothetical protein MI746_17465 [Pseudomonadales bacterium]|nr:hypothetical protein [Pseudomonadales bacterium]